MLYWNARLSIYMGNMKFKIIAISLVLFNNSALGWPTDLGCYNGANADTMFTRRETQDMLGSMQEFTIEKCIKPCRGRGYKFAAVRNYDCFCGDKFPNQGISDNCNIPCPGNNSQTCGGNDALNVYTVCPNGTFMATNMDCGMTCGKCSCPHLPCHQSNGDCLEGCTGNWGGNRCNYCISGMYGPDCASSCGHCLDDRPCDKETGQCRWGCDPGYNGTTCHDECDDGFYGANCLQECGYCNNNLQCNKKFGFCEFGCMSGYQGSKCKTAVVNITCQQDTTLSQSIVDQSTVVTSTSTVDQSTVVTYLASLTECQKGLVPDLAIFGLFAGCGFFFISSIILLIILLVTKSKSNRKAKGMAPRIDTEPIYVEPCMSQGTQTEPESEYMEIFDVPSPIRFELKQPQYAVCIATDHKTNVAQPNFTVTDPASIENESLASIENDILENELKKNKENRSPGNEYLKFEFTE